MRGYLAIFINKKDNLDINDRTEIERYVIKQFKEQFLRLYEESKKEGAIYQIIHGSPLTVNSDFQDNCLIVLVEVPDNAILEQEKMLYGTVCKLVEATNFKVLNSEIKSFSALVAENKGSSKYTRRAVTNYGLTMLPVSPLPPSPPSNSHDAVIQPLESGPPELTADFIGHFTRLLIPNFNHINNTSSFLRGVGYSFNVLWPLAFTILIILDITRYITAPSDRYGTNLKDVFLGTANNQDTLTSHLGNDLSGTLFFWLWPSLFTWSLLVTGLMGLFFIKYDNTKNPHTLEALQANAPVYLRALRPQFLRNSYLRWSQGYSIDSGYFAIRFVLASMFWLFNIYLYFADARIVQIIVNKIVIAVNQFHARNHCERQQKIYRYIEEFGNYVCAVCPDWTFVYANNTFDAQSCIDGLLSVARAPDFLLNRFQELQRRAQPYFNRVDFSNQNTTDWTRPEWQAILNQISATVSNLQLFNLSTPTINPNYVSDGRIQDLAQFLNQVEVEALDLHNQQIGPTLTMNVTQPVNLRATTYLDLSATGIDDEAFIAVSANVSPTLKTYKVANNLISDFGLQQSVPALFNCSIRIFDISYNQISSQGLFALTPLYTGGGGLEVVYLSGMDYSLDDLTPFWQSTTQDDSSLQAVDFTNTNVGDQHIISFTPYLNDTSITNANFQNNQITNTGFVEFVYNAQNTSFQAIVFSGNIIDDDGFLGVSPYLSQTQLQFMGLSRLSFTNEGLAQLMPAVANSSIKAITLAGNFLNTESVEIITNATQTNPGCLDSIDLSSNQIMNIDGEAVAESKFKKLVLDNNPLTDDALESLAKNLPESSIASLSLNNVGLDDASASALADALPSCLVSDLDISNNPQVGDAMIAIANKLIQPITNQKDLTHKTISIDLTRSLAKKGKPYSKLQFFKAPNTGVTSPGAHILCRVLQPAQIQFNNVQLLPNSGVVGSSINFQNCRLATPTSIFIANGATVMAKDFALGLFVLLFPVFIVAGLIAAYSAYNAMSKTLKYCSESSDGEVERQPLLGRL